MKTTSRTTIDFSQPMKQSRLGILIAFADTLQKTLRQLWALIAVFVLNFGKTPSWVYAVASIALFVLLAVIGFLKYYHLSFYIGKENREFVLNKGILKKKKTVVQISKIQQVVLTQNFLQKLLNLYALKITTAGSTKGEITVDALSIAIANALKNRLSENDLPRTDEGHTSKQDIVYIPTLTLMKTAVTSNYLRSFSLLFAFVVGGLNFLKDLAPLAGLNEEEMFHQLSTPLLLQYISRIVVFSLILLFCVNLIRGVFVFYNYSISFTPTEFHFKYGLTSTRNTIVQYKKVQFVKTVTNYFQRLMCLKRVIIYQKTSDFHLDKSAATEIPGADPELEQQLISTIFHKPPATTESFSANYRKIFPLLIGLIVLPVAALLMFYKNELSAANMVMMWLWVCFALLIIFFGYRNSKLFVGSEFIIVQSGVWDIEQRIINPKKIQAITVSQLWWHIPADVCHITLHTSAESIRFKYAKKTLMQPYINKWLFDMETATTQKAETS